MSRKKSTIGFEFDGTKEGRIDAGILKSALLPARY